MAAAIAGKAALALAPVVLGALHHKSKGPNRNAILARYRASRPEGYLTAADKGASERTRARIAGAAQVAAQRQRENNARAVTARGLAGPAAAALDENANQIAATGAEAGATAGANQEYNAFQSNLGYARGQNDTAFGAEMGLAAQEAAQRQAQDATFWNSMLETIPAVAGAFTPPTPTTPTPTPVPQTGPAATTGAPSSTSTYRTAPATPAQRTVRGNTGAVYR